MSPTSLSSIDATTLKSAHVWEVTSPIPTTVSGKNHLFLPANLTAGGRLGRRRRINVEIHRVKSVFDEDDAVVAGDAAPEICYVRIMEHRAAKILEPIAQHLKDDAKKAKKGTVNFFTGSRRRGDGGDDDDESNDGMTVMESFREPPPAADGKGRSSEGWQPKYKVPLRVFNVVERKKRTIIVAFEARGRSIHREFVFDDESACSDFCDFVRKNKKLYAGRLKRRLDLALGGIELKKGEAVRFNDFLKALPKAQEAETNELDEDGDSEGDPMERLV